MMNIVEEKKAYDSISGWKLVDYFSVGGLEWLGFSKMKPFLMVCISSRKTTIVDCRTGMITECEIDYDEIEQIAICEILQDEEIPLAGEYGGSLPQISGRGEKVEILKKENIHKVIFSTNNIDTVIYWNYGYYTCGFSCDGNYFVLASDGGIAILRRK